MITRTAWDAYYMVMSTRASPETKLRIIKLFIPWIAERINEYGKVSDEMMKEIRQVSRNELYDMPVPDRPEDVLKWVNYILNRGENNGDIHIKP